jgi:hypothetical protein
VSIHHVDKAYQVAVVARSVASWTTLVLTAGAEEVVLVSVCLLSRRRQKLRDHKNSLGGRVDKVLVGVKARPRHLLDALRTSLAHNPHLASSILMTQMQQCADLHTSALTIASTVNVVASRTCNADLTSCVSLTQGSNGEFSILFRLK